MLPPGDAPALPRLRVRFRASSEPARLVESDAHHLLRLLIAREPERARGWVNRAGQSLSVELLMTLRWTVL